MAPGATFSDGVIVSNSGSAPVDLRIDAVDGLTGVTSGAVYANRQDPVRRWGGWVKPQTPLITVAPRTRTTVGFTVQVPPDPGDHLAGVAFEDAHPTTSGGSIGVTTVIRSVIGVLVKVPGAAAVHLHIDGVAIQALPGATSPSVVVTLGDDGAALGKPVLSVTLDGPSGYHRTVTHQLDTLLPGDTIPFPLPWPDTLAAGDYRVSVSATEASMPAPAALATTSRLGATLVAPQGGGGATPAVAPAPSSGVPLRVFVAAVGAAVLLAILGMALAWRLARRR